MGIIVQKFGGTSVATPEARHALLNHVKKCKDEGNDVIVVVSAIGRNGAPYATDTLINLLEQINPTIIPQKKDLLMSCGEIISCTLISHFLDTNNIPSEALTGFQAGIITNDNFNNSEIIHIDTTTIKNNLAKGKVVVIAGFQGITASGQITTLGRGGSDTAAVAIGGYIKAERVDIFTDVPGIAKVDPRVVSIAPYISSISYDDIYKLAYHGAKVIHPRAVMTAKQFNIPVRVRSTFSNDLGTLISDKDVPYNDNIVGLALEKDFSYIKVEKEVLSQSDFLKNPDILLKKSENFLEAYYHKDHIDYPLDIEENSYFEKKDHIGQISIIFHENPEDETKKNLQDFLIHANLATQDIFWSDDRLAILLPLDHITQTVQSLYAHYH
ncbi:aspartate kinase [Marinisporobacter balticus]|uniref:Aspartokinase n=1 Tax=Marinisporobacter balticus TaxID=2018667 RepID=A0A4R2KD71_9FIRM|nr:aspartate kinase [Marinisporobacter balticus]TCO71453.1 aspartate kinase [Marinisporobacter balticus]